MLFLNPEPSCKSQTSDSGSEFHSNDESIDGDPSRDYLFRYLEMFSITNYYTNWIVYFRKIKQNMDAKEASHVHETIWCLYPKRNA